MPSRRVARRLALALAVTLAAPAGQGIARERVLSTYGFSFLPPAGDEWTEKFEGGNVLYLKRTDPKRVSFFAGATDGEVRVPLATKEELASYVRLMKEQWGGDTKRYVNTSASFFIEGQDETCVQYRLSAHDRKAKNKGGHPFLVMHTVGRLCLRPHDRAAAADIYYSVRHTPTFDPKELIAEGEAFIRSLQFDATSTPGTP
jgi:hypothetical protein